MMAVELAGMIQALAPDASPEDIAKAVDDYLDAHPEATTTVQDGSITIAKLAQDVLAELAEVEELKEAIVTKPDILPTDASGVDLDICDANGYALARFKNGHFRTKNFDSSLVPKSGEYLLNESGLMISFKYTDDYDAVVVFDVGRVNDLFDFKAFLLKEKGKRLDECESTDFESVWTSATDMHSPFQINATQNPDGYYASATDAGYTGGNHAVTINNTDVKSASSKYVYYFADGEPITSGYGTFVNFEIKWANNIQAYNCVKADGTGRTSLIEYHDMIFDGVRFNEEITLVPQEEIKIELWHGLMSIGWNDCYDNARFVDATNRGLITPASDDLTSGNNATSGIIQWGDDHAMDVNVDITCDLGKRTFYNGTSGAFLSNSIHKSYFYIIKNEPTGYTVDEGDAFYLRGSYKFYPVVE